MKTIEVKKGQILQHIGERDTKIYQVVSGLLRSYAIDEKGKKHIFMFAPEGWVIADTAPPERPSTLLIDALEDSVIIQREKDLATENQLAKVMKRLYVLQQRIIMLMSASALERYEHFIETYPDIVQRVPQRMIASYLGITPEALSTVKNKRLQTK